MSEEDLQVNQPQSNEQDALGQQEGVKCRYSRAQQELSLGKRRSLQTKAEGTIDAEEQR